MARWNVILGYVGKIVVITGISMIAPVFWSVIYREQEAVPIAISAAITIVSGFLMVKLFSRNEELNYREGFAIVTLGWVAASLFGTLPYLLTGTLEFFHDALFETVSGFTTTGSSVIADVEAVPRSVLFWRSLTHWLGGMGIMALFVAIMSTLGSRANQIFRAEIPGPVAEKISPRVSSTAKILWVTYVVISAVLATILILLGMPVFDALCHTFGTMATGGFSTKNSSIGFYNAPLIQWTITIFMIIAGASFSLHYMVYKHRSLRHYLHDSEFKLYLSILGVAVLLISIALYGTDGRLGEETIRNAAFQVASICTTTGYSSVDFNQWPPLARGVLFALMLVGGLAGSTAGGIKVGRYLIMGRQTIIEFKRILHPKAILPLKIEKKMVSPELLTNVLQFFFLYILLIITGTVVMSALGMDLVSAMTSVAASLGNIGPGLELVGPTQNYGFIPPLGKYFLSFLMFLGRLEIIPVLILLYPGYWKN